MNNPSSRHHYIPKFLIKRFCNANGKTYVFEKKKNGIREVSSKQIFFSWNRNTFNFKGKEIDNVENFYADLDNMFANVVLEVESKDDISSKEMMYLVFLANSLKWRIPNSDEAFSKWKDKLSFNSLGVGFEAEEELNNDELEDFKKNIKTDVSKEFKRMLIAMQPFRFKHIRKEILKGLFLLRTEVGVSVLGDNPIIELYPHTEEFIEDFIFPFSELDSLIFKKGSSRNGVNEHFYLFKDVAQLHLAEDYVICKDLEYLKSIIETHNKIVNNGKENSIVKGLFQTIE